MHNGYMNQLLVVNLSTGEVKSSAIPDWLKEKYVGGKGFGVKLLYDLLPARTDPLAPENPLMFMTGPLTGTKTPSMRACVVTKSPLTGTFLDSYFGGFFGQEIKYAGYDGIIIIGRAERPVYLWIEDNNVEIRSAEHLRGLNTFTTNAMLKKENGNDVKVACIGPAGENQVRFSLISCEYNRQAGRGGSGAVMGSKNLKAIAIRGNESVRVHDLESFKAAVVQANKDLADSPDVQALTETGTASAVPYANEIGLLPNHNYKNGTFDGANAISDYGQNKHLWLRSDACAGCPVRCSKVGVIRTGKYAGTISDIVEYESAAMIGANLEIGDVKAVTYLTNLCDSLGLDSMSTGGAVGFALEAVEKGYIQDADFIEHLQFGNPQGVEYLIKAIAKREGYWGELMADGVKEAAKKLGSNSEEIAVHIKGMEVPAWGPRGSAGMGLALMTADRGGCHQRGFPVAYEVGGLPWNGKTLDPLSPHGKGEMVASLQNYLAGLDTFVKCDFGGFGIQPQTYLELFKSVTGRSLTEEELNKLGERVWNMTKLFNLREGIDCTQDTLPPRFVKEALPDGPAKGHRITEDDMDILRTDYYQERGWDKTSFPTTQKLDELGISLKESFSL